MAKMEEMGCFGVAMMAMEAYFASQGKAASQIAQSLNLQCVMPNPQHFAVYQEKFKRYQAFVIALQKLNAVV